MLTVFCVVAVICGGYALLWGLLSARSKPVPGLPKPNVSTVKPDPCPACGSNKIKPVEVGRGHVIRHDCVGVPGHSRCQCYTVFTTEQGAILGWNHEVFRWKAAHNDHCRG